jgi:hypothetical protein
VTSFWVHQRFSSVIYIIHLSYLIDKESSRTWEFIMKQHRILHSFF